MTLGMLLTSLMPAVVSRAAVAGATHHTFDDIQQGVRGELAGHHASRVRSAASFRRAALTAYPHPHSAPSPTLSVVSSTSLSASLRGDLDLLQGVLRRFISRSMIFDLECW